MRNRQALSQFERSLLAGAHLDPLRLSNVSIGLKERYFGLIALNQDEDFAASQHFLRSLNEFPQETLDHAISERLYGLTLIKMQREIEGTFNLERANKALIDLGYELFEID